MKHLTRLALDLAEHGLFPDSAIRYGIRRLLKQRLREIRSDDVPTAALKEMRFVEQMRRRES
jgi:cyclopropane-fatty-acyl-phospholipid synthase